MTWLKYFSRGRGASRLMSTTIMTLFLLPVRYQALTPFDGRKMYSVRPLP